MKIFFKAGEQFDSYFCFNPNEENSLFLPENISLGNFLFFLQSSLDQIKFAIIFKDQNALEVDLMMVKGTHFTIENDYIFLNYSIRNSLKTDTPDLALRSFEEIHSSLLKILKN